MNRRSFMRYAGGFGLGLAVASNRSVSAQTNASQPDRLAGVPDEVRILLDPAMEADLLDLVDLGPDTYYIIAQHDAEGSGEPVFIRHPGGGDAVIIDDTRALPLEIVLGLAVGNAASGAASIDLDLRQYALQDGDVQAYVATGDRAPAADIDSRMHRTAQFNLDLNSKDAPGTNRGRLACAWAVNLITSKALGRPIGGGLATANMIKVLQARHSKVAGNSAPPGSVIISPTEYRGGRANVGHVGIVGADGDVFSNSSSRGRWEKNFTIDRWTSYYGGKGLTVQFFRLDGDYF